MAKFQFLKGRMHPDSFRGPVNVNRNEPKRSHLFQSGRTSHLILTSQIVVAISSQPLFPPASLTGAEVKLPLTCRFYAARITLPKIRSSTLYMTEVQSNARGCPAFTFVSVIMWKHEAFEYCHSDSV